MTNAVRSLNIVKRQVLRGLFYLMKLKLKNPKPVNDDIITIAIC